MTCMLSVPCPYGVAVDFETNGLEPPASVLTAAAQIFDLATFAMLGTWRRAYLPRLDEDLDSAATAVNGLTLARLIGLRDEYKMPAHAAALATDEAWATVIAGADIVVAHNADFEAKFDRGVADKAVRFCTMRTNADIVRHRYNEKRGNWWYPSLGQTARFYGLDFEDGKHHGAVYDAIMAFRIFERMARLKNIDAVRHLNAARSYATTRPMALQEVRPAEGAATC